MKNQVNRFAGILCLLIFSSPALQSQTITPASSFNLVIANDLISEGKILEFDLYLINMDNSVPFELASVQAGIKINPEIYNGGTIKASLVEGSSQLLELQKPASVLFVQATGILKLAGRIIRPVAKEPPSTARGSIISASPPGTRICRIRLTNTVDFAKVPVILSFSFERNLYPTLVSKYSSGINTPIPCNSSNCFSKATSGSIK